MIRTDLIPPENGTSLIDKTTEIRRARHTMEFYELNRLYDDSLLSMNLSHSLDALLYSVLPVFLTLGCGVSLLTVLVLLHSEFNLTSKNYLVAQCSCNFLFQIVSAIVLITNNYERDLLAQFKAQPGDYLKGKLLLNVAYNILLYCVLWFFTVGNLDFSVRFSFVAE